MAITISGANNVDKILATDGVLDSISGFNVVGVMTAGTFDVTGKTTTGHLNIGSNIQIGNAGIITATTLVGNVTGNVNATSNLLLQIGGSEKFRVASSGQLGIGGANYGSSGQVLTSGGSGSAATWSTITGTTINNNAANKVIMGSNTANTLEAVAKSTLFGNLSHGQNFLDDNNLIFGDASDMILIHQASGAKSRIRNTNDSGSLDIESTLTRFLNKDGSSEKLRITSTGRVGIGEDSPDGMLHIKGAIPAIYLEDTSGTHGQTIIEQNDDNLKIRCDAGNASSGGSNIRFEIDSGEKLRITSTGNLQQNSTGGVSYFKGSGEYVFGSNSSSPPAGGYESVLQVQGAKTRSAFTVAAYMNNSGGPFMTFLSSRSGTVGTLGTKCIGNDYIGNIRFSGDNGTNNNSVALGAEITARAKSTPSDGDTVIHGEITFSTGTTAGTTGVKQRLTIQDNGRLKFIEDDVQRNSTVDNFSGDGAYMQHYVARTGSQYRRNLDIASVGDGSWGSSIRFSTNPDSNATTSEAMRINHLRQVKIGGTFSDTTHQLLVDNGSCDFKGRVYVRESLSFYSTPFGANVTYDTGISVNGGGYGGSILAICSKNFGSGTNTQSGLYLIKFHYDGNNTPQIIHIAGSNLATFGQSGSNTLTVAMGASNNMFTAIESSVG